MLCRDLLCLLRLRKRISRQSTGCKRWNLNSWFRRSSIRHVDVLVRQFEFSEDRRKTSRGICLSNLTKPTKPVVYTDRNGVAGTRRLIIASYLFYLRVCARTHPSLSYIRKPERQRGGVRKENERERERKIERYSHKSKFHFNVLTKDQIKHFNWHFYGGRQPKSNSYLHPVRPCCLFRSREYA